MKYTLLTLLTIICACSIVTKTRNLDRMNEEKRAEIITDTAKAAIMKYFPTYYTVTTPIIVREIVPDGPFAGRPFYYAKYPYPGQTMLMSVKVAIWSDTGEVVMIENGDGYIIEVAKQRREAKQKTVPAP